MRFSRKNLLIELKKRRNFLEIKNNFDTHDGYHQVENKGESINREYGQWNELRILIDSIESGYFGYGE